MIITKKGDTEMNITYERAFLSIASEYHVLKNFLAAQDLLLDDDIEYTVLAKIGDTIIGSASLARHVIKCIGVDPEYRGMAITNMLISKVIEYAASIGIFHLFIFTKPDNAAFFSSLGFTQIAETDKLVLFDNNPKLLYEYVKSLESYKRSGKKIAAIVMNCNPFTYGHQFLIETACKENDAVHLFIVEEDKSVFPFAVRYDLVKQGTAHLSNLQIHAGGKYIISSSIFPSYFLKDSKVIVETHARLDVNIFGSYIAPALNIHYRYVGTEPNDPVTKNYNEVMKELLPDFGITCVEVQRKTHAGNPISASAVRKIIRETSGQEELCVLKEFVPEATYRFLLSPQAEPVLKKIREPVRMPD
ncbi:[citrate (pro-3S)-lyase] ligase [Treponema phagedenis]|uniref:[Citrate [pro-3S]-lyase] ligase n=2 Tax=Treponema phagedenis TaxID=162 RepID=A0A0B7GTN3_TREPH|nr:[citrate (pro-3S)-lyase] ligase [Treponema phagedenis F0421]QEJ97794.1 [citrate (pro-3S)-lyase] ligase [Treponema phagedenis]QEK03361.1 [citrate (pro-3S)-lyase] ligase [Treponema phagedenis]QEK06336.1 [citrate (pro-3S)-lyase] ligase [Treponema phagedenis]QEK08989.1 [citrate (pro-3S)-lyase] ligase [Treponema phagedenis]